jgi:hypothetical protein
VPLEGTAKKAKELTFKPTKTPHYCGAILKGTRFGLVRWKPTEKDETFTTALKGGYVATVWKNDVRQYFKLENREEQTQILVTSTDSDLVDTLYSEAKRKTFNVDKAIAYVIRSGS